MSVSLCKYVIQCSGIQFHLPSVVGRGFVHALTPPLAPIPGVSLTPSLALVPGVSLTPPLAPVPGVSLTPHRECVDCV